VALSDRVRSEGRVACCQRKENRDFAIGVDLIAKPHEEPNVILRTDIRADPAFLPMPVGVKPAFLQPLGQMEIPVVLAQAHGDAKQTRKMFRGQDERFRPVGNDASFAQENHALDLRNNF
jgi:hypothetical protein